MAFFDGPDCSLWVETHGHGAPVTVFAHGITGSVFDLEPLARRTSGTRVLFDLRGHGKSGEPRNGSGYGYGALRRDLLAVADEAGARRAFGLSAGAGAIVSSLARDPDRFERVVLMLPASLDRPSEGTTGVHLPLVAMLESMSADRAAERALDAPEYQALFAARPMWRSLVPERIRRMNGTGVPAAIRAHLGGDAPVPDAAALAQVRARALILAHRGDPLHDASVAERLAGAMPDATLRIWDEPLAMYDDLDALAELIGSFLTG